MVKKITLSEAKARNFKRHDKHYNRLMAQETETKVTYYDPDMEVDFSNIELVNNMVYVKATFLETGTPCFMVIE